MLALLVAGLSGCGGSGDEASTAGGGATQVALRTTSTAAAAEVPAVVAWNQLALDAARSGLLIDAQAARLYAMVNVAMFDAVNGIRKAPGGERAHAMVPPTGAPSSGSEGVAAAAAAYAVLMALNPAGASQYAARLAADRASEPSAPRELNGYNWGTFVGQEVVRLRSADGSSPTGSLPGLAGIGTFQFNWANTQFRALAPFAIADPAAYVQSSRPALSSAEYAAAYADVMQTGNAAVPDAFALDTFRFWASNSGTSQPPGEWLKVALALIERHGLTTADSARLTAWLGMAMADVVAPTYTTKYTVRGWRPKTAIRNGNLDGNDATPGDAGWSPRGSSEGSSPEYVSGHSAFAGAGATVLRAFFCTDAVTFTLQTDGSTSGSREYASFTAAETESGRSRVMGGVHFEFSNQHGLSLGRGVGTEVVDHALIHLNGPAHRPSDCPKLAAR